MNTVPLYLLDTNILLAFSQGNAVGQLVENTYSLTKTPNTPLISVITKGEILSIVVRRNWQTKRRDALLALYSNLVTVAIDNDDIIEAYAEIQVFSQRRGRPVGENDVWIAATARVTQAILLTADTDFDHLCPTMIQRDRIDPITRQISYA